ncbi:MAG: nitrilase family protein [Chloroflexota bacterium]
MSSVAERIYTDKRTKGKEGLITVAAIQTSPEFGQKSKNVQASFELMDEAADRKSKLIVLPELCNTGYVFDTRAEAWELAEPVPGGPTTDAWVRYAKKRGVYIVAGIAEKDGDKLFNGGVVIGPEGYIGKYRKLHLWDEEKLFFEPGDLGCPIFHLPFGRIGVLICYDAWHPEIPRLLTLRGADIICDPNNWVIPPTGPAPENPVHPYIHMAHAHMNANYFIAADRVGVERGVRFLGLSCISGPEGFMAGPASADKVEVLTAEVNIVSARIRDWGRLANPVTDRRVDVYDRMLGYRE